MEHQNLLDVKGVSSGYGSLQVIWDCSLSVGTNESVVVLGSNGSGKTTLLRAITGVLPLTSGSVLFDGKDVTALPVFRRARMGMCYVSENSVYPAMTVRENLSMSSLRSADGSEEKAAEVHRLFPDILRLDRVRASALSGGQRKMLMVAKAIVASPKLLIMDEPSSGLSPIFTEKIIEVLSALKQRGMPMLVSEQNIEFAGLADRLLVLDHGRIVFSGTKEEAERNDAIRSAYFAI
ncbi:MAG: ABC transporter ATP-binding protein [Thermoplasmata archaeon]|nr:ABC transporter ATP-binding protein [Candidatus Sysuiplasma acidicola]MBX8647052.1 ABC transporter ATP-binding protein [Candidatus Sysuiplasma acidicola]MDH2905808.1 ABC transporter ATP-binding protein [Methanomassiliicoccales archaeon]